MALWFLIYLLMDSYRDKYRYVCTHGLVYIHFLKLCLQRGLRSSETPVAMSVPTLPSRFGFQIILNKRSQGSLEKWLMPELGWEKPQDEPEIPCGQSKEILKK
jgi:hypothetical protein